MIWPPILYIFGNFESKTIGKLYRINLEGFAVDGISTASPIEFLGQFEGTY